MKWDCAESRSTAKQYISPYLLSFVRMASLNLDVLFWVPGSNSYIDFVLSVHQIMRN